MAPGGKKTPGREPGPGVQEFVEGGAVHGNVGRGAREGIGEEGEAKEGGSGGNSGKNDYVCEEHRL